MPLVAYLQSVKNTDLRFKILKYNKETKTATLQGKFSTFEITPFTKEKVQSDGYTLVHQEEE